MHISVRSANPDDANLIAEIMTEAMNYKRKHGDDAWGSEPYTEAEVTPLLKDAYVVRSGQLAAGTVSLQWEDELWGDAGRDAGFIHRLAIRDQFHGQQLGRAIIDWAEERAKEKGLKSLRLDCPASNKGLIAYYQSQGFSQVGTVYKNTRVNALLEKRVF